MNFELWLIHKKLDRILFALKEPQTNQQISQLTGMLESSRKKLAQTVRRAGPISQSNRGEEG